jgi:hypothetical protein
VFPAFFYWFAETFCGAEKIREIISTAALDPSFPKSTHIVILP